MAPFSLWGFLVGVFPHSWLFQKPGFESLCGEISSNKLFIVHCSGSILYESFVKLVERFVSNTHESIYLLVLKNFCFWIHFFFSWFLPPDGGCTPSLIFKKSGIHQLSAAGLGKTFCYYCFTLGGGRLF